MVFTDIPDDELILEMSARLGAGRIGYEGLMSRDQMNYRDMWVELYTWVRHQQNVDFDKWRPIAAKMESLAEHGAPERRVVAVNTTLIGREAEVA